MERICKIIPIRHNSESTREDEVFFICWKSHQFFYIVRWLSMMLYSKLYWVSHQKRSCSNLWQELHRANLSKTLKTRMFKTDGKTNCWPCWHSFSSFPVSSLFSSSWFYSSHITDDCHMVLLLEMKMKDVRRIFFFLLRESIRSIFEILLINTRKSGSCKILKFMLKL